MENDITSKNYYEFIVMYTLEHNYNKIFPIRWGQWVQECDKQQQVDLSAQKSDKTPVKSTIPHRTFL